MTRLDADDRGAPRSRPPTCDGPRALLLESREVPLGGVRAMSVHRSLPQRDLPLVGAWCFLDRFGPQVTRMRVEPHPHIGLQTVTWPFAGDIRHRDSVGSDVIVRRGALNLMTSGEGIAHSEYSVGEDAVPLDALQLWVALPESRRHGAPAFERHDELPTRRPRRRGRDRRRSRRSCWVSSPACPRPPRRTRRSSAPRCGCPPARRVELPLRPDWEYALVGVEGDRDGRNRHPVGRRDRRSRPEPPAVPRDRPRRAWSSPATDGALLFLLGGEPFEDDIVMWWNFVGRTHEEIVDAREAWESGAARFGHVVDHGDERVPAPPLPGVRLTRRRRRI